MAPAIPSQYLLIQPDRKTALVGPIQKLEGKELEKYLSDITPEDIRQSRQLWTSITARKELIDFQAGTLSGARGRQYGYNPQTMTYYEQFKNGSQRLIPVSSVKLDINRFAMEIRNQQRKLAADMMNGLITPQDWYNESARLMKLSYYAVVTVARGSNEELKDEDKSRWLLLLLALFLVLNTLADNILKRIIPIDGRLPIYAGLRGSSINGLFENWRLGDAKSQGMFREGRRVLGIAEHCHEQFPKPGCYEEALKGWMPVSELIPIGNCLCGNSCRCHFEFRNQLIPF